MLGEVSFKGAGEKYLTLWRWSNARKMELSFYGVGRNTP
jgi:hypothetical protein